MEQKAGTCEPMILHIGISDNLRQKQLAKRASIPNMETLSTNKRWDQCCLIS